MTFGQDASFRLEQPVGSMSISPCGRDVVLASREGLHIIDLDSPYSTPRYLPHHTAWEVADVQWSPFASRDYWVVSTSNQKALVWNLAVRSVQDAIECVLHGHSRAITDINFSAHHPDILATCAVDSFVHCWDLRYPGRPAVSFSDWFAGATQVKWSRQDAHVLASSHDRFLRIWDDRNGAYPLHSIEAHDTKIYGIDWNRFEPSKLVTCSLDRSIKFWNLSSLEAGPERILRTPFPVWRARHTPFGWGLLAMPQRNNNDLHLYDRRVLFQSSNPVKSFPGHKGQVKEFLWRANGTVIDGIDHRDFQLVTWGVDRELKLHQVDPEVLGDIGYEKGVTKVRRLQFTRRGATYKTFRDEPQDDHPPPHRTSHRHFSSISGPQPHLRPRGSQSVGMSKISLPQFRGWVQGRRDGSRTGMHGRARTRPTLSPISWMKNVRINTWEFETLADEITQVGDKLKKVEFEDVDVNHRRATVSLHGPWGDKNAAVYLRVEMRFPKLYPHNAHARFTVQRTASMNDTLMDTLTTDMQTIAETYASRRKGCIEAILRYLLRDQTLEQAISLILDDNFLDTKSFPAADLPEDVSSDDDDDDDQIQAPAEILNASNANVRVPLAKACGALWSDNGRLVCFFPPKREQPSMMDSLELGENDRLRSVKVFEGFGRLQTSSPGPRTTLGTKTTDDENLSDSSDSTLTSSDSSESSDAKRATQSGFLPRKPWHRGVGFLRKSRSTERSNRSINDFGANAAVENSRTNVVTIHDFSDMIPSNPQLAMGYQIFGNGPEVCEHNAQVASQQSEDVIASVWKLAKLILQNNVPLELLQERISRENILTIAKKATQSLRHKDSGVDLSCDSQDEDFPSTFTGRVRWGNSPLGPNYLIPTLFDHYEALGDVQMLAMLSCVFAEPRSAQPEALLIPHKDQDLSIELKAPAFSVDYYPSSQVARSLLSRDGTSVPNRPSVHYEPNHPIESGSSGVTHQDEGSLLTDTLTDANSMAVHHSRRSSAAASALTKEMSHGMSSAAVSLSTSPEESRLSRASSSAHLFPFSKAGLSALQQSYSHSPPNGLNAMDSHKSHSPSGGMTTSGWSTSALFGGAPGSRASRTSLQASATSSDEQKAAFLMPSSSFSNLRSVHRDSSRLQDSKKPNTNGLRLQRKSSNHTVSGLSKRRKHVKVKTKLYNQNKFDQDGYASIPLLDPQLEERYKRYRASYAHLLAVWRLYPQMAEVLKFDGLVGYFTPERSSANWDMINGRRRKTLHEGTDAVSREKRGLELRRCCPKCRNALGPIEKNNIPIGWHCTTPNCSSATRTFSRRDACSICGRFIHGLMVPCLQCGHVTCADCAEGWFGSVAIKQYQTNSMVGNRCPTGCGCACPTLEVIDVSDPPEPELEPRPQETLTRHQTDMRQRTERLMSEHGPDKAIGAYLSMTRTKGLLSGPKESILRDKSRNDWVAVEESPTTPSAEDELNAWSSDKFAGLGRGYGGGFSRGLSTKSSDATIRKAEGK